MAEFCYDCYKNKLEGTKERDELVISKELDLCEGCGECKRIVVRNKNSLELLIYHLFKNKKDRFTI